jgi:hypothetical protein
VRVVWHGLFSTTKDGTAYYASERFCLPVARVTTRTDWTKIHVTIEEPSVLELFDPCICGGAMAGC